MSQHKNKENGNWYIRIYDPESKKSTTIRHNSFTNLPFKTKKEARDFENFYLKNRIDLSMCLDDLFSLYIEDHLSMQPSSSAYKMTSWYNNQIKPNLGKRKIISLTLKDLEDLSKRMLKQNYSINYINKMTSNVKTVLNYGVSHGYLDKNRLAEFKGLKNPKKSKDSKYWTPREFKTVIESVNDVYKGPQADRTYIKYMLTFGYLTGARKGEIRALRWIDIEMNESTGIIHFDHHINDKNELVIGRKNGDGYIFHMDSLTLDLVKKIKAYFSSRAGFSETGYVFPSLTKDGFYQPIGDHTPTRWIENLARYNHLNNPTFHGLRTSNVCWLATEIGLTPYEVADRIGDTVEVVLRHYYSFFQENRKKVADKISGYNDTYLASLI